MPSPQLVDAVLAHGENRPERVALVSHRRTVTYRELADTVRTFRHRLGRLGPVAGNTVCVPAHKSPETLALMLAAFREGLVVLAPSPDLGGAARDRLCRQARASHLLAVTDNGVISAEPVAQDAADASRFGTPDPGITRLLLTTSGSTGTPKIVPIPLDGFAAFADWAARDFGLTADDTSLSYAPLNFDLALLDVWTFLREGARVVLVDQDRAADGAHLRHLVAAHTVTFVQGVPLLHRLLTGDGTAFPTVRQVVTTGEALGPDLLRPLAAAFPGARFHNVFGCTETNDSFIHPFSPATCEGRLPIGRPVEGVRAELLTPEGKRLSGPGMGELLVTTPFQTSGYLESSLNAKAFTEIEGHPYYRTGDLVTRGTDGLLYLEGRADWQVKIRGVRTNLLEVETVIASHPDVTEAVVVALPDEQAGVRLHAQVVRRPTSSLTGLGLRAHAGRHLPRHAIPSSVRVTEAPLPRTSTGKPDRGLIKADRLKESA
ncbi:AMP-binding protein [Streptomyces globisporus]|uniref:Fatty acid--CoA ligase n=3 Tax=Streptomyces albovinaceus subgroup TaxID=1482558 RepID=A0ABN8UTB8_STRGL|nr:MULTISPECIES: AMP-binding protein [Streptomyces]PPA39903.1 fatty acid--CoA ligase [Streptomyces griseus]RAN17270.1 fatty acid--CoA ligase [Streptomyces badius]AWL86094.1 fatty acid--CoA ligase [Streptomyces globisporus]RAN25148.1 fatty acid--CoA ligase [Streptomyces badius]RDL08629.1 acyl-CoA synthetase (AMP-forming)/AMP-acid ligase II [Streptomyces sp. HB202]